MSLSVLAMLSLLQAAVGGIPVTYLFCSVPVRQDVAVCTGNAVPVTGSSSWGEGGAPWLAVSC
jgi:hypothetical protein